MLMLILKPFFSEFWWKSRTSFWYKEKEEKDFGVGNQQIPLVKQQSLMNDWEWLWLHFW